MADTVLIGQEAEELAKSAPVSDGDDGLFATKPPKKKKTAAAQAELKATLMASIPFIGFLLFTLFPMGISLIVSFTNLYSYDLSTMEFLGFNNLFGNFIKALTDSDTLFALQNSLIFCVSVPLNIGLSLLLAHVTTRGLHGSVILRVVLFIPSICVGTAVAFIWQMIFADNYSGVINSAILELGGSNIGFMSTKEMFMPSVVVISVWITGTNIIAMQSALSSVSPTLKEAARIDGATEMRIFWQIIFPMITPTLFYQLVMTFIGAMQEQGLMQILSASTSGLGPGGAAITLSYQVYRLSFGAMSMSYGLGVGCALSWLIAILITVLVKVLFWISDKWVNYESD